MSRRVAYNLAGVAIALLLWEAIGRLMGEALFAPLSVVLVEYVKMLVPGITIR
jgi:hypothetical protein